MSQRTLAEEGFEPELLHGNETRVWDDSAYTGQTEVIRQVAPYAQDFTNKKGYRHQPLSATERAKNRTKSRVRAKGEHRRKQRPSRRDPLC